MSSLLCRQRTKLLFDVFSTNLKQPFLKQTHLQWMSFSCCDVYLFWYKLWCMFCACLVSFNFSILNPHQYVVSATYSFKVWEGGTSNFYEETNYPPLSSHPVSSGLYDLFVFFGPFDHTVFGLELESHSNPNEPGRSFPTAWWKRMRCPSEFKGHQMFIVSLKFFTHVCFFEGAKFRWFYWRYGSGDMTFVLRLLFSIFLPTQWCWSRSFFMLWGAWCAALLTDLKQ